ncbi:MAG: single-stranded DNA-binding protein [Deltaproteobacteria bacterium]|nr:single-stranded DNA-binding protein [Deltaproteobacteria bacterium]
MGINKVILVGNLGANPELRYTPSQYPICTLRLATTEKRKGQDGTYADQTEWHSVVVFGKQAENCNQYLQKGRQIYVEGRIQTRKWQDKEGKDRYKTEILASTIQFLGGKSEGLNVEKIPADDAPAMNGNHATMNVDLGEPVSFNDDDIPF